MKAGVDVGPTNTDAALLGHADAILSTVKVASVPGDPVASVTAALGRLGAPPLAQVAVGLRGAASAVDDRRGLYKVAVLRIGGHEAQAVRPLFGWPEDLLRAVCAGTAIVDGGGGLDREDWTPLDTVAVARFAAGVAGRAQAVAITGLFSPLDAEQELEAADIVRAELGELPVALSADLGSLGLIERENATVLDAALSGFATDVAARLAAALSPVTAVHVTRGDGTLMSLEHLARHPGLSLGSGPASMLRGAGVLTGLEDAVVADVGARRVRVGALAGGFPEEAPGGARIGGVPVGLRIPELIRVPRPFEPAELAEAVDRMQPGADRLPLVVVGGGERAVPGGLHPAHGTAAGAIGAATSPVGGQYERVVRLPDRSDLPAALEAVIEEARASAVRAGADPRHVRILEAADTPLAYLPGPFVRLRARAAGPPAQL
ncbi:hydantoinase/oxoprolinase N-terminal domain-containing protein [Nonomuraea dietziae]|uniref:N-methylhydantoinase A/oxoprolinase/acetone carboxylase beta subunit n=1 Tax=Nonomuraea dietziae TaxID=65515 RepID=A0A7W5YFP4_9ACTN|nr:hydantoinase/oxoprolinase N-terminal domain-containing protein [Nonomuraea dietziae]MBB3733193.1 N-methylhydantoinase A/oxoprolinase/acetone carboxylase beta subunit [Nonomuraea dietziae]